MKKLLMVINIVLLTVISLHSPFLQNVEARGKVSEGSGIANIILEDMKRDDATVLLEQQIEIWQAKDPISAENDYETVHIPRHIFQFNIEATLDELEETTKRHWSNFFQKRKNVQIPLKVEIDSDKMESLNWSSYIDKGATLDKAVLLASNLQEGNVVLEYKKDAAMENFEIADVSLPLPEASRATIIRLAEELNKKVFNSGEAFSFLDEIDLPTGMANSEMEMSFVASALYMLILHTEMEVIERHQAETVPTFAEPGLEAIVDRKKGKNLLIYNPAVHAYSLEAAVVDDELQLTINTTMQYQQFSYVVENEKEIEPRTIYRYTNELSGDEQEIITEGQSGLQLEIHRQTVDLTGALESSELISRDYYPPQHEVVFIAANSEPEMNEEAQETQRQVNESTQSSIIDGYSLEDKMNIIDSCEGDAECETANQISPIDKMIATCFTDIIGDEQKAELEAEIVEPKEENRFCDLIYMTLIFHLFSNEDFLQLEEQFTEGEFSGAEGILEGNSDLQELTEEVE